MYTFIIFSLTLAPILCNNLHVTLANNRFAADVYRAISSESGDNFVVSPFSAETVLALALFGARGQTQKELQDTLHLSSDLEKTGHSFKELVSSLRNKKYDFHTANKLYLKQGFQVNYGFNKLARNVFDAEVDFVDFSQSSAAQEMNEWVENQTNNKIKNLITPDKINAATRAILINALYFKANWSSPFRKFKALKTDFYTPSGYTVSVSSMTKNSDKKTFNYVENINLNAKFLELPFEGEDASMVFVLPNSKNGLPELEKNLNEVLAPQNFRKDYINMTIPKFKLESQIDFRKHLQDLGVTTAFSPNADFGAISEQKLALSDVIQKTFIDVHESGVEAASATYAGLVLLSIQSSPEPKEFYVDHPFLFYIKIENLIVFVGRVVSPPV